MESFNIELAKYSMQTYNNSQKFQYPAFTNFLDEHTRLNNYIKITIAGLHFLYSSTESETELARRIGDLIKSSGERWSYRQIEHPKMELISLRSDLAKTGIVWVYSAFDVFFKTIEGLTSVKETNSNESKNDPDSEKELDNDHDASRVSKLYKRLGWDISEIENLLPLLKFYDLTRHCIAHNSGSSSETLLKYSKSHLFLSAMASWKTKSGDGSLSSPPQFDGSRITLSPHHCITYSETCRRISSCMNRQLFAHLGLGYFVKQLAKSHLFRTPILIKPYCSDSTRYLAHHLFQKYRLKPARYSDLISLLSPDYTKKDIVGTYNNLKVRVL